MKFDLTKPCGNMCPFRTDCLEGWLGEERAEEIADNLAQSTFPCHKTTAQDDDSEYGELVATKDSQHCAGALIMLEKMEQPSQMMRIAEQLGFYDRFKLDMNAPVFDDAEEFIEHHSF